MTRIDKILLQVRDSLSDPDQERWSDDRLLRILSEGQKDIARQTQILKGESEIPLLAGQYTYDLPEDLYLLMRVVFGNEVISLMSHQDMDHMNLGWFSKYGPDIQALVYDKLDLHKIRTFPIPNERIAGTDFVFANEGSVEPINSDQAKGVVTGYDAGQLNELNGVLTDYDINAPTSFNSLYGVLSRLIRGDTKVTYYDDYLGITTSVEGVDGGTPYGLVSDIDYNEDFVDLPDTSVFSSDFGVITNIREITSNLKIYYIKDAPEVVNKSDELTVPSIFDTAIKYYIIAKAYADDIDAEYQTKSDRAMLIYQREMDTVGTQLNRTDGTRSTQYRTRYRGAF